MTESVHVSVRVRMQDLEGLNPCGTGALVSFRGASLVKVFNLGFDVVHKDPTAFERARRPRGCKLNVLVSSLRIRVDQYTYMKIHGLEPGVLIALGFETMRQALNSVVVVTRHTCADGIRDTQTEP